MPDSLKIFRRNTINDPNLLSPNAYGFQQAEPLTTMGVAFSRQNSLVDNNAGLRMFSSPMLFPGSNPEHADLANHVDLAHMDLGQAMAFDIMMAQEQGENQMASPMEAPPLSLGEALDSLPVTEQEQAMEASPALRPNNWKKVRTMSTVSNTVDYMGFLANQKRQSMAVDDQEIVQVPGMGETLPAPLPASVPGHARSASVASSISHPAVTPTAKPAEILKKIDLRSFHVPQLQAFNHPCNITVIDYSRDQIQVVDEMDNDDFMSFLQKNDRPSWATVRWINLEGLSYDIIRMLAIAYHLHPLAIEDMVTSPRRVKADHYEDSLFVCAALVSLMDPSLGATGVLARRPDENARQLAENSGFRKRRRSMDVYQPPLPACNVQNMDGLVNMENGIGTGMRPAEQPRRTPSIGRRSSMTPEAHESMRTPLQFTWGRTRPVEDDPRDKMRWCNVGVEAVNIFLTRDGTVISFFQDEGDSVTVPVTSRIHQPKTLLRTSEDPSFLVMALLDSIVDHSTRIVAGYADEISQLEMSIFKGAKALYTKQLHLLENELVNLKRVLIPTRNMIQTLKTARFPSGAGEDEWEPMSNLTRFYLSDVLDHADSSVEDIHDLEKECTEQVELVFNTINHDTNNSLKLLSVVSLVFLPMTFVAGAFGTNFVDNGSPYEWDWSWQLLVYALCAIFAVAFYYLAEAYMFGKFGRRKSKLT